MDSDAIERMDEQVETFWLERRWLKMLPSEYFKRQCYVSLIRRMESGGVRRISGTGSDSLGVGLSAS